MKIPVVFLILTLASIANAKIIGLPSELTGPAEQQIQESALEGIAEMNSCDFSEDDVNTLKVKFVLLGGELQDKDYAEYEGELQTLEIGAKLSLPAGKCEKPGKTSCKLKFDLYDEKAYELNIEESKCK